MGIYLPYCKILPNSKLRFCLQFQSKITLVVMNVKNVFFKSALKTFFSYFSVLNDKNV